MGSALTNADSAKITCLVRDWCSNNRLTLITNPTPTGNSDSQPTTLKLEAKHAFYKIIWRTQTKDCGIVVDLDLKLRPYFNVIIHAILFTSLFYCTSLINAIVRDYNYIQVIKFGILALFVIVLIWWKDNRLSLKLARIESSFWEMADQRVDLEHLTKTSGSIYTKQFRFVTEVSFFCFAIYICSKIFGVYGFIVLVMLGSLFLIMIIAEIIRKDNPHWHWRFWITSNMAKWTISMLMINTFLFVLFAIDILLPLQPYQSESIPSIQQVFKTAKLRDIKPATADNLEKDCFDCFQNLAEDQFKKSQEKSVAEAVTNQTLAIRKNLKINGIAFFIIAILVPVFFFIVRPFYCLLRTQKIWASEVCSKFKQYGPFVPYISQSWKWKTPLVLRMLIFFHCIIGGIINITAVLFCIDGWSYMLAGRSLFFEKSANLWSWPFAVSKISFGERSGMIVGVLLLISICLPLLFLFAAFARRIISRILFLIRVFRERLHQDSILSPIQDFTDKICTEYKLKKPVIILTKSRECIINLMPFWLGRNTVIEISTATTDLLSFQELKTVLAHELGHLRQGLWQIEILKLLSSVLFFPNYYLTLCIDWSGKEIDADKFAIEVTKDCQSLKTALIKTATYQLSCMTLRSKINTNFWSSFVNGLNEKLNSISISIKFFFGDRLLGYIHPNLSERLEAIGNN